MCSCEMITIFPVKEVLCHRAEVATDVATTDCPTRLAVGKFSAESNSPPKAINVNEARGIGHNRGGVAGPAGPALRVVGPFSDCRDSLRTRGLGQVSHASSPFPCVYAFLVIVPALLPAVQEPGAARPDCIGTYAF